MQLATGSASKEKYIRLPNDALKKVKPVYLELCSRKFLQSLTQNANECSNGIIWQRVPKDVFVCLNFAVIQFNESYHGCLQIFQKLSIDPGFYNIKTYEDLDGERIRASERLST